MASSHTLFYDGVCGFCDRLTQYILSEDQHERFRFAALQGAYAQRTLAEHGVVIDPTRLNTLYVITADGRLLDRSDAAVFIFSELDRTRRLARLVGFIPRWLRNIGYALVARTRFWIFGKADACRIPRPDERARFIADSAG